MYTKSILQTKLEEINFKDKFVSEAYKFMEGHKCDDVFISYNSANNKVEEVICGYYQSIRQFDTIVEAIEFIKPGNVIRIIENKLFEVGVWKKTITECIENRCVTNIENYEIINW